MSMKTYKRRDRGQGGLYEYATKSGEKRWYIKFSAARPGEPETKAYVRRQGRDWGPRPRRPFTTRRDALAELDEIRGELKAGAYFTQLDALAAPSVVEERLTVGMWLDKWLEGRRIAPSTRASYAKNIRVHLRNGVYGIGDLPLVDLTSADIAKMYRTMEAAGRQDHKLGGGLSPRTVRYIHTILKAALQQAVEDGVIVRNPAAQKDLAPTAKEVRASRPEMSPWTRHELRAFLDWCEQQKIADTLAYWLLGYTGMRRGELLALRWRDLTVMEEADEADNRTVTGALLAVRRSVSELKEKGKPARLMEGPTKSAKPRVIDIDPGTTELLLAWKKTRGSMALALARQDALIFGTLENAYQDPDSFSARFIERQERCLEALQANETTGSGAELKRIRLHDLRHTHATLLLEEGVHVKVVSERLGHASVTITLDLYVHTLPGMQAAAAAQFAARMRGAA